MIRILIADHSRELCQTLKEQLDRLPDMQVVGEASDGEQALAQISELEPDVVIMDIILPFIDGMAVMERMGSLGISNVPQVIILTALGTDEIMQRFIELGAAYFMIKPCDYEVIARRIRQFAGSRSTSLLQETRLSFIQSPTHEEEEHITRLLHEIGVPSHFKGYNYLRDAVLIAARDAEVMGGSLTRLLYPRLAEKYGATASGVEAAIRHSVVACWEGGNRDLLAKLTGSSGARRKTFPTNAVVITKLADEIRMGRQIS